MWVSPPAFVARSQSRPRLFEWVVAHDYHLQLVYPGFARARRFRHHSQYSRYPVQVRSDQALTCAYRHMLAAFVQL